MISRSSALILFFISANCINTSAMEQTTPSSITKTVMVTLDADSPEPTPLKQKQYYCHFATATLDYDYLKRALPVKILIEAPENSPLSAQEVYNQNAEKFNNEWGKVVKAFIHMMTKGKHADHMIPLMPTSFYFHPQSNLVIASCEWGTHAITNHVTATLETRYHCIYNSQNDSLNHRMSKLLIKQANEHKTISVDIDTLNAVYPRPESLACAKNKMQGLLEQFTYQMVIRRAFLQQGVTENLPDPLKFLYDLYKEDLKKLAANYLHYQVTELIGDID